MLRSIYNGVGFQAAFLGGAPPLFTALFIFVFAIIAGVVMIGTFDAIKNISTPIIDVQAEAIAKRIYMSYDASVDKGMSHGGTLYYVTFETEHGERLEFRVSYRVYGKIIEGDKGTLIYQGKWFKDFQI